jgi:hypothetical protein
MKEKDAQRLYHRELWLGLAIYTVLLVVGLRLGRQLPDGVPRTLAMASPMLGFVVALWAIIRQFRRMDEYVRRVQAENLAIAAGLTAGWTFTYGFLENAGFPKLSMFWVWPVMGAVWFALACMRGHCKA